MVFFDPRLPNSLFYSFFQIPDQKFEFFMYFTYTVKFLCYLYYFEHCFEKNKETLKKCLKMAQILFLALLSKERSVYKDPYTKM